MVLEQGDKGWNGSQLTGNVGEWVVGGLFDEVIDRMKRCVEKLKVVELKILLVEIYSLFN